MDDPGVGNLTENGTVVDHPPQCDDQCQDENKVEVGAGANQHPNQTEIDQAGGQGVQNTNLDNPLGLPPYTSLNIGGRTFGSTERVELSAALIFCTFFLWISGILEKKD